MALTDPKIRALKSLDKPYKVTDSGGLYILVKPGGAKHWYLRYRFGGKETRIAFGAYPAVTLAAAREKREEVYRMLAENVHPALQRVAEKVAADPSRTLQHIAIEWHKSNKAWSENHATRILGNMNNHIFPVLGKRNIADIKRRDLTALLENMEQKNLCGVAVRVKQYLQNIMRYAVQKEYTEQNPATDLDGLIAPPPQKHYPALALENIPVLLHRIEHYAGRSLTRLAVHLTLHLFIRSSELRFSRWSEFDLNRKFWTIPATREPIKGVRYSHRGAKMRTPHVIPLSSQAVALLEEIKKISGHLDLVFPGDHDQGKPMSENTVNKALRVMGFNTQTEVCGHGFRAMACSALLESERWSKDAIERQMSHQERNSVRAAYIHKAEFLESRTVMMQWWSDYLDTCREGFIPPYIYARQNKAA
ncbi:DUF4102 domain-containing protein [Salmonella enterica subsp. enterica]|nr:DUF4102 domain-containing protein [Salmonella enterica subsp. enterica]